MGYAHIQNLYKNQDILLFKEVFALEKVHGTSAHLSFALKDLNLIYFSGGEKHNNFIKLFDHNDLVDKFYSLGREQVTIYGEAYGGKCQGMSKIYGPDLKFIAFEVQIDNVWLDVLSAEQVVKSLGLLFVPYSKVWTDISSIDQERDKPSIVSMWAGCGENNPREGVILRPLIEVTKNNGERIIAKHKSDSFSERATPQKIVDVDKLVVLQKANEIANEWVNEVRLSHVLDHIGNPGIEKMRDVISGMIEDVEREAAGEIVVSHESKRAIGARTAQMFKDRLKNVLYQ